MIHKRAITFPEWELRTIRDGHKTQFRRPLGWSNENATGIKIYKHTRQYGTPLWGWLYQNNLDKAPEWCPNGLISFTGIRCPWGQKAGHGQQATRLWVREAYRLRHCGPKCCNPPGPMIEYRLDNPGWRPMSGFSGWSGARSMPEWVARFVLEVQDVRLEPLWSITVAGGEAEGLRIEDLPTGVPLLRGSYREHWDAAHGKKYPWDSNPYVWVVDVKALSLAPAETEAHP